MIRHIFKIIWNERKINAWVVLEFIVVFTILWFCCDFLYYIGKSYIEYPGYDIKHTYLIQMGKKKTATDETEDKNVYYSVFSDRVKQYPGVESLSFSYVSMPNSYGTGYNGYQPNNDSTWSTARHMQVTPEFFDVFRIQITSGRPLEVNDIIAGNNVLISPNREGEFGEFGTSSYGVEEVRTIRMNPADDNPMQVVGTIGKIKHTLHEPFRSAVIRPLKPENIDLAYTEITIRVNPAADKNFIENFMTDMKDQLLVGPYFLISVVPLKAYAKAHADFSTTDNLNSTLAITAFLMMNIFLGLIGTFWVRIQSRRSEIGLRIALGSSKRKVQWMLFAETFIMLFLSSLVSIYICLNLSQSELLDSLGIPTAERVAAGIGSEQDLINYVLTFLFLLIISGLAVWYPARQAAKVAPAEALRSE